jgi:hypothetical protein
LQKKTRGRNHGGKPATLRGCGPQLLFISPEKKPEKLMIFSCKSENALLD